MLITRYKVVLISEILYTFEDGVSLNIKCNSVVLTAVAAATPIATTTVFASTTDVSVSCCVFCGWCNECYQSLNLLHWKP